MNCLVGCSDQYVCGEIIKPVDANSVAPFVKISFCNEDGVAITVGNKSSPQWDNTAIIKAFQIGTSNGLGIKVEIIDEQGGSFHSFVERLNKCIQKSKAEYSMAAQWGWVIHNCDGTFDKIESPEVYVVPIHLEVNFSEGRIKFIIEGTDTMQHVFVARHDEVEGTDAQKVGLKQAIRMLGQNTDPKFDVNFIRIEKDGTFTEFEFKEGKKGEGPKSKWTSDGQNKLAIIQKWIEPFVTDRDKGIIAMWNPMSCQNPIIDLVEDPQPDCNEERGCGGSIGTYIVNGGACSPVISFNPTINYVEAFAGLPSPANTGSAASGKTVKTDKKCPVQTQETGTLQSIPPDDTIRDVVGAKRQTEEKAKGEEAHGRANLVLKEPIRAELRVQGDPREEFCHPKLMIGKTISLIVINPFHLFGSGNGGCGDWLSQPGCNDVLSNKSWIILGASHEIKEGSYVTTLQIQLLAPGATINPSLPFGGPGSGGFVPNNSC